MKFDVEWDPAAENELTEIWLNASAELRATITQAARAMDRLLEKDPAEQGESRPNNQRMMFELRLGIIFEVDSTRRMVRVLHVWKVARRKH
jgi:plasmid stabilization system protein ParE